MTFHGVTTVPVLSEAMLREMAEETFARVHGDEDWAGEDHEAWVQAYVNVGLMLSGQAIPH